jgi:hypothetical protein
MIGVDFSVHHELPPDDIRAASLHTAVVIPAPLRHDPGLNRCAYSQRLIHTVRPPISIKQGPWAIFFAPPVHVVPLRAWAVDSFLNANLRVSGTGKNG